MNGDLAELPRDDQMHAQTGDTAVDGQFLAAIDGLRSVAGNLDDHSRTALDEGIVVGRIAQNLDVEIGIQRLTGLQRWSEPTTRQLPRRAVASNAVEMFSAMRLWSSLAPARA